MMLTIHRQGQPSLNNDQSLNIAQPKAWLEVSPDVQAGAVGLILVDWNLVGGGHGVHGKVRDPGCMVRHGVEQVADAHVRILPDQ